MTFNQRNVEIAKRWQEIEKSERDEFNRKAREDVSIVDEKTRTKRLLKKIKDTVCYFHLAWVMGGWVCFTYMILFYGINGKNPISKYTFTAHIKLLIFSLLFNVVIRTYRPWLWICVCHKCWITKFWTRSIWQQMWGALC